MLRKPNILGLLPEEVESLVTERGLPRYRADQIFQWVHKHGARSFEEMTNLPADLRASLPDDLAIFFPENMTTSRAGEDQSQKLLYRMEDGTSIESVRIVQADGVTACVSSQAGCRYDCKFCATARGGFKRSLQAGEIVGQILAMETKPKRIVYMGMGEPLANYRNVVKSIRVLTHPDGFGIAPKRITVSTVGLVPLIKRLSSEYLGVRLAISLTSADDAMRSKLMPINEKFPLAELLQAARDYAQANGDRVTFEYPLLKGYNDSDRDAALLIKRLAPIRCQVNLIPFNPVEGTPFEAPPEARVSAFARALSRELTVTVRRSAGREIDAACGQLQIRYQNEARR